MHLFPKANEKLRNTWIKFVQKHRGTGWHPSPYSALCSAHFEMSCFTQRLDIGLEVDKSQARTKRWLNRDAYPTIDTVVPVKAAHEISMRKRRQVI